MLSFNWPAKLEPGDEIGEWCLDKVAMALCYPRMNKDVFSGNEGLVDRVVACWKECDAQVPAFQAPAAKSEPKPKRVTVKAVDVEDIKLSPEQIEKIVPLMLRNTQVGSSVQVSDLHGKDIEEQIDMFTLSAEMLKSARGKGLRHFKGAEGQIAYTSVSTANRCTTVLAVNPNGSKFT